jgi:pimeloyl-ACP methyl ester carboxylesterase
MVHGFALDHRMWVKQVDQLAANYRIITLDVPGCGSSPLPQSEVTLSGLADAIMQRIDGLIGHEPAVFVGLSMGGYIGWEMLNRNPGRFQAAIMCDTRAAADSVATAEGRRQMAANVLAVGTESVMSPMLLRLISEQTYNQQPETVELMRSMLLGTAPQTINALQLAMANRHDFQNELGSFHLPMLLICGSEDILTPPKEMKRMAEKLPHSRFVEVSEAGHMAPLEKPSVVNSEIISFLQSVSFV